MRGSVLRCRALHAISPRTPTFHHVLPTVWIRNDYQDYMIRRRRGTRRCPDPRRPWGCVVHERTECRRVEAGDIRDRVAEQPAGLVNAKRCPRTPPPTPRQRGRQILDAVPRRRTTLHRPVRRRFDIPVPATLASSENMMHWHLPHCGDTDEFCIPIDWKSPCPL